MSTINTDAKNEDLPTLVAVLLATVSILYSVVYGVGTILGFEGFSVVQWGFSIVVAGAVALLAMVRHRISSKR